MIDWNERHYLFPGDEVGLTTAERTFVGKVVRSWDHEPFDHPDYPDRYVEGVVTEINELGLLVIEVAVDKVFIGNPRPVVMSPLPGHYLGGEWEGRIELVNEVAEDEVVDDLRLMCGDSFSNERGDMWRPG